MKTIKEGIKLDFDPRSKRIVDPNKINGNLAEREVECLSCHFVGETESNDTFRYYKPGLSTYIYVDCSNCSREIMVCEVITNSQSIGW